MNKKLLNVLKNIDTKKMNDFLDKDVRSEFISSCYGDKFQGWHHDICIDVNGVWSISGQLSNGSYSMGQHEGREICLYKLPSWYEFDFELSNIDLENLNEDARELLLNEITAKVFDTEEYSEYLDTGMNEGEKVDIYYFNNYHYKCDLEELFKDNFPNTWEEAVTEYFEEQWYVCKEDIINKIESNIETNISYLESTEE